MVEAAESDLSAPTRPASGRVVVTAFPSAAVAFAPALARSLKEHHQANLAAAGGRPGGRGQPGRGARSRWRSFDEWTGRMSADLAEAADGGAGLLSYYHLVRDPLILVVGRDPPGRRPGAPGRPAGAAQRVVACRAGRRAVAEGGRPAACRGRADPARPLGVRGPRHGRQPGCPRAWHRDHAAARRRRLRAAGSGPRAAGGPRPGQGRVRGGAHGVGDPPVRRWRSSSPRCAARPGQWPGSRPPAPDLGAGRVAGVDHDLPARRRRSPPPWSTSPSVSGDEGPLADAIEARAAGAAAPGGAPGRQRGRGTDHGTAAAGKGGAGRPHRTVPPAGNFPSRWDGAAAVRVRHLGHEGGGGGPVAARGHAHRDATAT